MFQCDKTLDSVYLVNTGTFSITMLFFNISNIFESKNCFCSLQGVWFSLITPVSSTDFKPEHHNIHI